MSSERRPLSRPVKSAAVVVASTAVALTVGLVCLPSPASAAPNSEPAANSKPTALVLTIAQGENPSPASRAVVLGCAPVRGTHPAARQACDQLTSVSGDVSALSEDAGICTLIYDPVTVTLRGVWQGEQKNFRATYPNSCVLHRKTRAVFSF